MVRHIPEHSHWMQAKKNRDVLLAEGQGHTIFQVAEIQRLLGKCSCKGRTSAKAL